MKLTSGQIELLKAELNKKLEARGWNASRLARESGVNQGHVSKIVRGKFKTLSSNVSKICITLGISTTFYQATSPSDQQRKKITDSALSIWNGGARDADLVSALLREIARFRRA